MFNLGAHLSSKRTGYTHHGIYIGSGRVIHYSGLANGLSKGHICETSFEEFNQNRKTVSVIEHVEPGVYSNVDIVKRAKSRLGEDKYNLYMNNCEHFATWCVTGLHESAQVETVTRTVSLSGSVYNAYNLYQAYKVTKVAGPVVNTVITTAARLAPTTALTSAAPAVTGLTSVAGGAGLTTAALSGGAGTSTLLGLTSASVATAAAPVVLAAGGVALVGYGVYKLWTLFDD